MTRFHHIILLLGLTGLCSCYNLQSDEELRQDIVGSWTETECKYPNNTGNDADDISHPLRPEMTFYADGRFTESGGGAFCTLNTCDEIWSSSDCRCQWEIQDGRLVIIPESQSEVGHLNTGYPIKCLKGDLLVFDNADVLISGNWFSTKSACYTKN